ncbi:MAG: hemolysin family protein [Candidatus Chromulinivorax sp.]|nr:hemolysin family protein [Candidatus Chromulinivorax sp.]
MEQYAHALSINVILFLLSLFTCALLSFLETSITAMRLFKLKELELTTPHYKHLFEAFDKHPQNILISILIATNLASVTCAVISQQLTDSLFESIKLPEGISFILGIFITTIMVSIFGEIIPKTVAQSMGSKTFTSTLWIVNIFYKVLGPIANYLNNISLYFSTNNENEDIVSEKEIQFLINYIEEKGLMDNEKTAMLQNIFSMGQTSVKEILIPKSDMISININDNINTFLDKFAEYQFSRFPVYQDHPENIIGIVYLKDILFTLQKDPTTQLQDIIRPIIFVPDNMKVNELLKEFKLQQIHMAMVLDEYGNTIGLVTLEDALEEIVGDIHDEHDINRGTEKIKVIKKNAEWAVDATIDLDRLHPLLKITFEAQSAVTLGGFISEQMQHIPKIGESLTYKGFCFTIEKADAKRVLFVRIETADQVEINKLKIKK